MRNEQARPDPHSLIEDCMGATCRKTTVKAGDFLRFCTE